MTDITAYIDHPEKLITRIGKRVFLMRERKPDEVNAADYPIEAVIENDNGYWIVNTYTREGYFCKDGSCNEYDLVLKAEIQKQTEAAQETKPQRKIIHTSVVVTKTEDNLYTEVIVTRDDGSVSSRNSMSDEVRITWQD
jgi:hypothetical protein